MNPPADNGHKKHGPAYWVGVLLKYVIPPVITVGLCRLLLKETDLGQMWHIISTGCDFRWIAAALCLSVVSHVIRAMRWRIQLSALGIRPGLWALVLSIFGTYAVNLVFPRLGELWRTGYIARRTGSSFTEVFGSMVADRLADSITVLIMAAGAAVCSTTTFIDYLSTDPELAVRLKAMVTGPWMYVAVGLFILAFWWFMSRPHGPRLEKIRQFIIGMWRGFAVLASMQGRFRWLLLTVALWGCYGLQLFLCFFAFDFTAATVSAHGLLVPYVAFVLSSISMVVPSNGGIGPWQYAVIFVLGAYGVATSDASAFANLVLGTQTLLLIALGLFTFVCVFLQKKKHNNKLKTL